MELNLVVSNYLRHRRHLLSQLQVYDVTKFLIEHPGGEEVMLEVAGEQGRVGGGWEGERRDEIGEAGTR